MSRPAKWVCTECRKKSDGYKPLILHVTSTHNDIDQNPLDLVTANPLYIEAETGIAAHNLTPTQEAQV